MKNRRFLGVLIAVVAVACGVIALVLLNNEPEPVNHAPLQYTFSVVKVYPHDAYAFTEGLVFDGGFLYEGTGLSGNSTLRRVELETGRVLQLLPLQTQFFGEGITIFNDTIIQLTWQSNQGFVYDKETFALLKKFSYPIEGWGITSDGSRLIMSDGTANLYFLDPQTFKRIGQVEVHNGTVPVTYLNELEYVRGDVYANVWLTDKIAIINPESGQVKGWINLTRLDENLTLQGSNDVLNGIAYDAKDDRLFVTGKMWPQLFEIKLIPED